jgi:hypothetical protein
MKKTILYITLIAGSLVNTACIRQYSKPDEMTPVTVDSDTSLIQGHRELFDSTVVYRFPFILNDTSKDAQLRLDFIVVDKGHCPLTYVPTKISLNGELLQVIDFREFEFDTRQIVEIPMKKSFLVKGKNTIEIVTGQCDYDIDDMMMNDMRIELK